MQFTDQSSAAEPCEQDVLRRQFRQGVSKRGQGSLHVTIHSSSFRTPSRLTHQRGSPESWEGCLEGGPAPQKFPRKAQRQFQEAWAAWLTWAVKRAGADRVSGKARGPGRKPGGRNLNHFVRTGLHRPVPGLARQNNARSPRR